LADYEPPINTSGMSDQKEENHIQTVSQYIMGGGLN
jgi:hypothetical protein